MKQLHRVNVLGCPFDAVSFSETVTYIRSAIAANALVTVVPGNIDFIIKARRNANFAKVLWDSDLVVADGKPIVWIASLLKDPIRKRVSGTDLVWACAGASQDLDFPVALIGGMKDTAARAAEKMKARFAGAQLHPIETPFPLRLDQSDLITAQIKSLKCKIVLVALGAPRQELWIRRYLPQTGANVGIGIGSAFDIICGDRPRAPRWMQEAGLEWLHRMMLEPRRLGKRYLIDDTLVFRYLAAELFNRGVKAWRG